MKRQPELCGFSGSTYETIEGRIVERKGIFARIQIVGLKGEPIEVHELSLFQALQLLSQLAQIIAHGEGVR